jgi:hypothetical protein
MRRAFFVLALIIGCSKQEAPAVRPDPKTTPTPTPTLDPPPPKKNAVPAQWACEKDVDCTISCAKGAVNQKWWDAWDKSGECKDGCAELNKARCEDGGCIAVDSNSGKPNPGCTRQ